MNLGIVVPDNDQQLITFQTTINNSLLSNCSFLLLYISNGMVIWLYFYWRNETMKNLEGAEFMAFRSDEMSYNEQRTTTTIDTHIFIYKYLDCYNSDG